MTNLLGSKRWIAAVVTAGALVAVSGCTASGPDAGEASPSASSGSSASPSRTAGPSASPSPTPTMSASVSPAATPSPAPSPAPSSTAPYPAPSAAPSTPPSVPPSPSPDPSSPAAGGTCTAAQLTGSVQDQLGGGAAGSAYRTLVLTNASDRECTVAGYPGVSFVDAAGNQIGAPAEREGAGAAGVSLAPGASATTTLRQTNAQNYGPDCGLTPAAGLRVYPPGATDFLILPQELPACSATSIVLMTVGALQLAL
jgi:hypothetical protein